MKEYVITDMKRFCKKVRKAAVDILNEQANYKNMREFITLKQCKQIIENACSLGDNGSCIVNENVYDDIIFSISKQIYQSALSKLAAQDIIECAWDDKDDKMIFWIEEGHYKRYIDLEPL